MSQYFQKLDEALTQIVGQMFSSQQEEKEKEEQSYYHKIVAVEHSLKYNPQRYPFSQPYIKLVMSILYNHPQSAQNQKKFPPNQFDHCNLALYRLKIYHQIAIKFQVKKIDLFVNLDSYTQMAIVYDNFLNLYNHDETFNITFSNEQYRLIILPITLPKIFYQSHYNQFKEIDTDLVKKAVRYQKMPPTNELLDILSSLIVQTGKLPSPQQNDYTLQTVLSLCIDALFGKESIQSIYDNSIGLIEQNEKDQLLINCFQKLLKFLSVTKKDWICVHSPYLCSEGQNYFSWVIYIDQYYTKLSIEEQKQKNKQHFEQAFQAQKLIAKALKSNFEGIEFYQASWRLMQKMAFQASQLRKSFYSQNSRQHEVMKDSQEDQLIIDQQQQQQQNLQKKRENYFQIFKDLERKINCMKEYNNYIDFGNQQYFVNNYLKKLKSRKQKKQPQALKCEDRYQIRYKADRENFIMNCLSFINLYLYIEYCIQNKNTKQMTMITDNILYPICLLSSYIECPFLDDEQSQKRENQDMLLVIPQHFYIADLTIQAIRQKLSIKQEKQNIKQYIASNSGSKTENLLLKLFSSKKKRDQNGQNNLQPSSSVVLVEMINLMCQQFPIGKQRTFISLLLPFISKCTQFGIAIFPLLLILLNSNNKQPCVNFLKSSFSQIDRYQSHPLVLSLLDSYLFIFRYQMRLNINIQTLFNASSYSRKVFDADIVKKILVNFDDNAFNQVNQDLRDGDFRDMVSKSRKLTQLLSIINLNSLISASIRCGFHSYSAMLLEIKYLYNRSSGEDIKNLKELLCRLDPNKSFLTMNYDRETAANADCSDVFDGDNDDVGGFDFESQWQQQQKFQNYEESNYNSNQKVGTQAFKKSKFNDIDSRNIKLASTTSSSSTASYFKTKKKIKCNDDDDFDDFNRFEHPFVTVKNKKSKRNSCFFSTTTNFYYQSDYKQIKFTIYQKLHSFLKIRQYYNSSNQAQKISPDTQKQRTKHSLIFQYSNDINKLMQKNAYSRILDIFTQILLFIAQAFTQSQEKHIFKIKNITQLINKIKYNQNLIHVWMFSSYDATSQHQRNLYRIFIVILVYIKQMIKRLQKIFLQIYDEVEQYQVHHKAPNSMPTRLGFFYSDPFHKPIKQTSKKGNQKYLENEAKIAVTIAEFLKSIQSQCQQCDQSFDTLIFIQHCYFGVFAAMNRRYEAAVMLREIIKTHLKNTDKLKIEEEEIEQLRMFQDQLLEFNLYVAKIMKKTNSLPNQIVQFLSIQKLQDLKALEEQKKQPGIVQMKEFYNKYHQDGVYARTLLQRLKMQAATLYLEREKIIDDHARKQLGQWPKFNFFYAKLLDNSVCEKLPDYYDLFNLADRKQMKTIDQKPHIQKTIAMIKLYLKAVKYDDRYIMSGLGRAIELYFQTLIHPFYAQSQSSSRPGRSLRVNDYCFKNFKEMPIYKFAPLIPQLIQRLGQLPSVIKLIRHQKLDLDIQDAWRQLLFEIFKGVIQSYPLQSMWWFTSLLLDDQKKYVKLLDVNGKKEKISFQREFGMLLQLFNLNPFSQQNSKRP